jgi:hypothetical protein
MKKIIFIPFFVSLLQISFSQDNEIKYNGFRLGINFSPEFTYRKLSIAQPDNIHSKGLKKLREDTEIPMFSFTTGIFSEYKFAKRISVKFALHYTLKEFKTNNLVISEPNPNYSNLENYVIIRKHRYFGIPISLSFYYVDKPKIQMFITVGSDLDYLYSVSSKSIKKYEEYTEWEERGNFVEIKPYNLFSPSLIVSAGIDWQFTNKMSIRIEPIFRWGLITLIKDDILYEHFYNVGVNFSLFYSFLKREPKKNGDNVKIKKN